MKSRALQAILETKRTIANFGDYIGIGSAYIHDLISLNKTTLHLKYALGFPNKSNPPDDKELRGIWDKLISLIESGEISSYITGHDEIPEESRIKVYYEHNGEIVESYSDVLGWPNTTFDGVLMYNNTHFKTKKEALARAIKDSKYSVKTYKNSIREVKERLYGLKDKLKLHKAQLDKFSSELVDLESSGLQ